MAISANRLELIQIADAVAREKSIDKQIVIQAMADRPKTVVLAAILEAASHSDQQVRLSAINALGRVGDASCLATLLDAASETDAAKCHELILSEIERVLEDLKEAWKQ